MSDKDPQEIIREQAVKIQDLKDAILALMMEHRIPSSRYLQYMLNL